MTGSVILIGTDPDEAQCFLAPCRPYVLNIMDWNTVEVTCHEMDCVWLAAATGS